MKCVWCKGTFKECGCGFGHCAHCKNGEVTDPPYGPLVIMRKTDFYKDIPAKFFDDICDFKVRTCLEQIEFTSIYCFGSQLLSDKELQNFKKYWEEEFRDESIGEVLARIVYYICDKNKLELPF